MWLLVQFWAIGPLAVGAALAMTGRARWGLYLGLLAQLNLLIIYGMWVAGWRLAWNDPGFMRVVTVDVIACAVTVGALAFLRGAAGNALRSSWHRASDRIPVAMQLVIHPPVEPERLRQIVAAAAPVMTVINAETPAAAWRRCPRPTRFSAS